MSPVSPQFPQPEESDALSSRLTDTVLQLWNGTQAGTTVRNRRRTEGQKFSAIGVRRTRGSEGRKCSKEMKLLKPKQHCPCS